MLTENDLPQLLSCLGFERHGTTYRKYFGPALLEVDTALRSIRYPEAEGLLVNERQTCNFGANENFVVLECVCRLLQKGYKPAHIELEPKWKLGRGASGGRADILIKDNAACPLLLIECKTAGLEFKRAWNKTLQDGDQLFSYAQQISETQFLCLYTSELEEGQVRYTSHVIAHRDNEKYLADNPQFKSFRSAADVKERFAVWRDTYKQDFTTKGIFESNIQPYHIGKNKYTLDDLSAISARDQQKKYHEFATILRQHNVSGRENAFDKLVNLFLCKLVDEIENPEELKFYWKGVAYDTHFDLMDRLQQLYQAGMEKFLGENITYINQTDVFNAMRFIRQNPDATQRAVWQLFIQQKFFTNNDFSLIDVHNEKLFYQNAEVLLKILQMWQDIRLTNPDGHNQFLGDMFEGFLDQGVKQSEGQFFTPMPICRFILMSLPLETMVREHGGPPKAIDYACGAGHFLTELALQLKPLVERHKPGAAMADYHRAIYGIEKEYRLSKVAKVSSFMYGQQDLHICYGDALVNQHAAFAGIQDSSFDLLVANPPYSVRGFLETLPEAERQAYALTHAVSDPEATSSIETFFIERAKQLLRGGGVAAIILPSSVLSNGDGIYVRAREILLGYFDLVAIAEFGSGTFGKTGTNTVTLFLRRKQTLPDAAQHYRERVDEWLRGEAADAPAARIYQDQALLERYCAHIDVPLHSYKTLLQGQPDGPWAEHLEDVYLDKFNASSEIAALQKTKSFKALPAERQAAEIDRRYLSYVRAIERNKLYHFALACSQSHPVLIIRSPTETKAIKQFLGYEWSASKGQEGIKLVRDGQGRHLTPLYDESDRDNAGKLNALIAANFEGRLHGIPEDLQAVAKTAALVDMLDFSRPGFEKQIILTPKDSIFLRSVNYPMARLVELASMLRRGKAAKYGNSSIQIIKSGQARGNLEFDFSERHYVADDFVLDERRLQRGDLLINSTGKGTAGRVTYFDLPGDFVVDSHVTIFRANERLLPKFGLYSLARIGFKNIESLAQGSSGQIELSLDIIGQISIPLPPLGLQAKVVEECEIVDTEVVRAKDEIRVCDIEIEALVEKLHSPKVRFSKLAHINPSKNELRNLSSDLRISFVDMAAVSEKGFIRNLTSRLLGELRKGSYTYFAEGDILVAKITPCMENGKCALATGLENGIGMGSTEFHVFRADTEKILPEFLFALLNRESIRKAAAQVMTGASGHRRVPADFYGALELPVPPISDQESLISAVSQLKLQIQEAQAVIDSAPARKQAILEQYL